MRRKSKLLLPVLVFALAIGLSIYLELSLAAGRALTGSEFVRFTGAISLNSVLHFDEDGGSRSLQLAKNELSNPVSSGAIDIGGRWRQFPLPKYSMRQKESRFMTFATLDELDDYFSKELPAAGWRYVDHLDTVHHFENGDAKLFVMQTCYLGTSVSEINVSIEVLDGNTVQL